MVYYPLTTLIESGIREICLISTPEDLPRFRRLLGDGKTWGLSIEYREQPKPQGIAQAFLIAESFIGDDAVALILGDSIFYGSDRFQSAFADFKSGAIFGYQVSDPQRYGVVEFDGNGQAISIEEKPKQPKSNYAIPGLYLVDNNIISITKNLKPSARGQLEITDVGLEYLRRAQLRVYRLGRGFAWLDAETSSSLHEVSAYVQTIEKRAGIKVGCPEEAAFDVVFAIGTTRSVDIKNAKLRISPIFGRDCCRSEMVGTRWHAMKVTTSTVSKALSSRMSNPEISHGIEWPVKAPVISEKDVQRDYGCARSLRNGCFLECQP